MAAKRKLPPPADNKTAKKKTTTKKSSSESKTTPKAIAKKKTVKKTVPFSDNFNQIRVAISDITGLKEAEEELQKAKDTLENMVNERTAQLSLTVGLLQKEMIEHSQTEKALNESRNELRSMYDAITDMLTVISPNYRIMSANRVVEKRFGKGVVGKVCYKTYQGRDEICPDCPTKKAIVTKEPAFSFQPATEVSPPVEIYAFPILDDEGEVIAIVEHGKDVTERKKEEDEIRRLNKEMEQIINVTSHDLRTHLAVVDGYGNLMKDSIEKISSKITNEGMLPEMREMLAVFLKEIRDAQKYMHSNTVKMDSLLKGLLKLSRSGRIELNIRELDMNSMMSEIYDIFELQIRKAGAKFEISGLPSCRGDELQINQVFSNLMGNALKHLDPERRGIIKVSGHKEEGLSVYCVEDNGIGIAPEHEDKIFEIFYQVRRGFEKGEGLGLTMVRRILDRHKGRISVESEVGKGSKFCVSLPA